MQIQDITLLTDTVKHTLYNTRRDSEAEIEYYQLIREHRCAEKPVDHLL